MKKYTVIFIAVALAVVFVGTAMANEWSLYGSARVSTFYTNDKLEDRPDPDAAGRSTIKNTVWNLQNNARIGATVKGDMIDARFEYGARFARRAPDDFSGSTGATHFANVRRLFATWKFTEGWGLKVGKDYTPITFFLSGQVFEADAGLLTVGNAYGGRQGQLALEGKLGPGNFKFAFINPNRGGFTIVDNPDDEITVASQATENYWPKMETSYQMQIGDMGSAHGFIGFNNTKVYLQETNITTGVVSDFSETLQSWAFGLGAELNFGPMFVKPQASYYINGADGGWLGASVPGTTLVNQGGVLFGRESLKLNSVMAMLALGFSPTEQLTLELGGGYLYAREKGDLPVKNKTYYELYLQAVYQLAPGVYVVPEAGIREYGKVEFKDSAIEDFDLGSLWYFGAKWQIDF